MSTFYLSLARVLRVCVYVEYVFVCVFSMCLCVCVLHALVVNTWKKMQGQFVPARPLFFLKLMPAPKFSFPVVKVCRASSCDILLSQSKLGNRETWADASRTQVLLQDQQAATLIIYLIFCLSWNFPKFP